MEIGGIFKGNGRADFTVWAPFRREVSLKIVGPDERVIPMGKDASGYWHLSLESLHHGVQYYYRLDGSLDRPDPASQFQPTGIHRCSELIDHTSFRWSDAAWRGPVLNDLVIYEIHVGTFTSEGTFDAAIARLSALKELGITAVELMPVAQFPGERNWGYDGAYPFAVQDSYGGPDGLKRLVDGCHHLDIAVIIDVVYNHFGPEGAYNSDFAPYTTAKHNTPWGNAINFDDEYNDGVRNYFIENARHWFLNYHIDILRLDAVHSIKDLSARPFLQELADNVVMLSRTEKRPLFLIAESDLNDSRLLRSSELNGYGLNAQWVDDFHHCIHSVLTGEKRGYYADFGSVGQLAQSFNEAFVFTGQYSGYRKKRYGNTTVGLSREQFVVYCQNHDQTGNRMQGERLASLVSFEACKLAAATVLLSPFLPLIFMGEEYGEETPFLYFVSHGDPLLAEAVSRGRKDEFRDFHWTGDFPDPQAKDTFMRSKINWELRTKGRHGVLLAFYKHLLQLRREMPAFAERNNSALRTWPLEKEKLLFLHRRSEKSEVFCIYNFNRQSFSGCMPFPNGDWRVILDSSDTAWSGPGAAPRPFPLQEAVFMNGSSIMICTKEQEG